MSALYTAKHNSGKATNHHAPTPKSFPPAYHQGVRLLTGGEVAGGMAFAQELLPAVEYLADHHRSYIDFHQGSSQQHGILREWWHCPVKYL